METIRDRLVITAAHCLTALFSISPASLWLQNHASHVAARWALIADQARQLRAAQSSPPRPLGLCIADMQSPRASEGLTRHTHEGIKCTPFQRQPASLCWVLTWEEKKSMARYPTETHADHRASLTRTYLKIADCCRSDINVE